jgi:hypothetical protein
VQNAFGLAAAQLHPHRIDAVTRNQLRGMQRPQVGRRIPELSAPAIAADDCGPYRVRPAALQYDPATSYRRLR